MPAWLRHVIGLLIVIHGYVYIPFAVYLVNDFQRSYGTSKLLRRVFRAATLRTTTLTMHVTAGVMLLACGLLVAFAPGAIVAWRTLAVAGGAMGMLAFVTSWNGRPSHLTEQGILGATASLAIVVAALALAPSVA